MQRIIYEIDSSLNYIHDKGVAHLDLSAANILKNSRGHWVLGDFGFSQELYSFDHEELIAKDDYKRNVLFT